MADDLLTMKIAIDDRDYLKVQNSQKKFQYSLVEIERAYRKGEITSKQYNRQLVIQTKELQRLGFTYAQASSQVRKYAFSLRNATENQLNMSQAIAASGKGMRRFELVAQQAGYQVGDFAVQVQSGTNVAVAFGQQMSQLLGFFGAGGALAGAGIAIATAFVAPLMRAKEEVESLTETTKKSIDDIEKKLRETRLGVSPEEIGFIDRLSEAQSQYEEALENYNDIRELVMANPEYTKQDIADALFDDLKAMQDARREAGLAQTAYDNFLSKRAQLLGGADISAFGGIGDARYSSEAIAKSEQRAKAREQAVADYRRSLDQAMANEYEQMQDRLKQVRLQNAKDEQKALEDQAQAELRLYEQNLAYEKQMALDAYAELGDAAEDLGKRLGISFAEAIEIIKQAKAEATVGLDAFGGAGAFKYSSPTSFDPNKGKKKGVKASDVVGDMLKQVRHQTKLMDLTESQQRKEEILFELREADVKMSDKRIEALIAESEALYKATKAEEKRQEQIEKFSGHIENAFMAIVDGSQSVESAFKSLMRNIILDIYQQMVAQRAASTIMSFLGFANGGAFSGGKVTPFASGGVVNGPTLFPMSNGMGLMGESGPEAIMPLKRGKDGKLGVEGGGTTIVQNINVSTGVQQTVRTEIKSLMPQIAESAKAAVVDAKRRGGSYGRVFN